MINSHELCSFKGVIKSFKHWPRIFRTLWNIDKKYLSVITVLNIVSGIIPIISILITQWLLNAIQTSRFKPFRYVLIPFTLYIVIVFFRLNYNANNILLSKYI